MQPGLHCRVQVQQNPVFMWQQNDPSRGYRPGYMRQPGITDAPPNALLHLNRSMARMSSSVTSSLLKSPPCTTSTRLLSTCASGIQQNVSLNTSAMVAVNLALTCAQGGMRSGSEGQTGDGRANVCMNSMISHWLACSELGLDVCIISRADGLA